VCSVLVTKVGVKGSVWLFQELSVWLRVSL